MTAVMFTAGPDGHVVRFAYDPTVVAAIKATVPSYARAWRPATRTWLIDPSWAPVLADTLRCYGHTVTGLDDRRRGDRQCDCGGDTDWARTLFPRVGPTRYGPVFRALSRVLHPDTASGDVRLQRELNTAHAELLTQRKESA
jgi:hypothetical protein